MRSRSRTIARRFLAAALFAAARATVQMASAAEVSLDGRAFSLPDGFTIVRVAGPPMVNRPIAADFDEQGRLYVADSSGSNDPVAQQLEEKPHRIVRLEDGDGDGTFDRQTVFADRMMLPQGAMWSGSSLYVAAPPSIWRLSDRDGDGVADERVEWFQGKTLTRCANDLHGPFLGPDGWIYWCKGAFAQQTYERSGGRGPLVTRASHIFRSRPDNSAIEPVMTGGMENPVDVVFTPGGERILSATFLQRPAGGHRDGLIHAVYGGVYGRPNDAINAHPHTSDELMPALSHLGPAAPCGLTRYESDGFGPDYRNNLFTTLFNMHKVTRHALAEDGATFKSHDFDFLVCDDADFHPTDVLEDADGSLLVVDTGGWYKLCCPTSQLHKPDVLGAIYRISRTGAPPVQDARGLKLSWARFAADELVKLLDDHRPTVRGRAVRELAGKGERALDAMSTGWAEGMTPRARLGAVWAATQMNGPRARGFVAGALGDGDAAVRQAAAHSAGAWRDEQAVPALLQLLTAESAHNRRAAAEALGRIGDAHAVPALLDAADARADRFLAHSITFALLEIGNADATAEGLAHAEPAARRAAMVALDQIGGDRLGPDVVAKELSSPQASLRDTAAWIAGRHPEWGESLAGGLRARLQQADRIEIDERASLRQQLARLARSPAVQALLAERLSDGAASAEERQVVLAAMRESGLGKAEIPETWVSAIADELAADDPARVADAVSVVRRLPLGETRAAIMAGGMLRVAGRDDLPPNVRLDAAAAAGKVRDLTPSLFKFLLGRLAPTHAPGERVLAATVIGGSRLTPEQLAELTGVIRSAGPLELTPLLAAYEKVTDDVVGLKVVAALRASKASRSLRPDIVKTRLAGFGPDVRKEAEELLAKLHPDAAAQQQRLENVLSTLPAGDVRRGQALFNSTTTACASCHAVGYRGGKLGPDLTRIGGVRTERDLLESVLFPSASFVQSFEPVMVQTAAGEWHAGVLRRSDEKEVVLATGPEQEVRIAQPDVKELRPGVVSVMPDGLGEQLKPQDLADLITFLKACK